MFSDNDATGLAAGAPPLSATVAKAAFLGTASAAPGDEDCALGVDGASVTRAAHASSTLVRTIPLAAPVHFIGFIESSRAHALA